MYKKIIFYSMAIVYCNFNYVYSHEHSHHHSPQQSHLSPEKQIIFNNYQKRIDTLQQRKNDSSYTTSGFLIGVAVFGAVLIAGLWTNSEPAKAGGMLGGGVCGLGAFISGMSTSTAEHTNQQEIADLLIKQEKLLLK